MDAKAPILQASGLCKRFDERDRLVLDDVSLTIAYGESVALMGPSGCGKTTLLSILAGLMLPDAGALDYWFPGLPPTDRLTAAIRRHHVGIVFQSIHLIPTLTVLENVEIPMFGVEKSADRRLHRAREVVERLGLSAFADMRPHQLSGGERQRVAIGRAFANRPILVFADEPTGNLDTVSSEQVVQALLDMASQTNGSLLVVTHNPGVAACMDRILTIVDGRIVANGAKSPAQVGAAS